MKLASPNDFEGLARTYIFKRFRELLERAGNGEDAIHLEYVLRATPGGHVYSKLRHTYSFEMSVRESDFAVDLDTKDGTLLTWLDQAGSEGSTRSMPEGEAFLVAERLASPQDNAVLVTSDYEMIAGTPVYVARWEHIHDGLPVEGDYIHTCVNGSTGRVFSHAILWHAPSYDEQER